MNKRGVWIAFFSVLAALAVYWLLPESCPESARRMAIVFVIAAAFWALEIIPLYATAFIVVLLQTFLLGKPGDVFGIDKNSFTTFLIPFSNPIIMLFLGGFVLARALQKYNVDRWIAVNLLQFFGEKPYFVLLGFMTTTAFISMWISNTATTALMLVMVMPLLGKLNPQDPFRKALVLAIAFAANIGGIATPVGTPPNGIALGFLAEQGIHLNFFSWMMMGVPLAVLLIMITSVILYLVFPPQAAQPSLKIEAEKSFLPKAKWVMAIATGTILLWLTSFWHQIPESMVALLAVAFLTAFQFVDRKDFNSINWDILVLMWGGLALGQGMETSGLAKWIVSLPIFSLEGFSLLIVFCLIAVLLSTFMSNTAAVNLLIPIALSIPGGDPVRLAIIIALASSFDLALPISTPPMAMAYGTQEIRVKDMLKVGILFTLIANFLLLAGFEFVMKRTLIPS